MSLQNIGAICDAVQSELGTSVDPGRQLASLAFALVDETGATSRKSQLALANTPFATTVAIANTGTPDGVAHITGQVTDGRGVAATGRFLIGLYLDNASYGDPEDLGTLTALTNSRMLIELTNDALALFLSHSDGTWGAELDTASNATVHAHAVVLGKFATTSLAITGN